MIVSTKNRREEGSEDRFAEAMHSEAEPLFEQAILLGKQVLDPSTSHSFATVCHQMSS